MVDEDKELILDFTQMDEGLAQQGAKLKLTLYSLLGVKDYRRLFPLPTKIRGTSSQISSFRAAAGGEKRYMNSVKKHGLHDPRTYATKTRLNTAIRNFERETGMKWPIK